MLYLHAAEKDENRLIEEQSHVPSRRCGKFNQYAPGMRIRPFSGVSGLHVNIDL